MGNLDADFKPQIFRNDRPQVLACQRQLATLLAVRMRYRSTPYRYGTVIARNSVDGLYDAYDNAGSSGTDTAAGILKDTVDFGTATGGSQPVVCIAGGKVYENMVSGLDAGAKVDLKGRSFTDAEGTTIFMF